MANDNQRHSEKESRYDLTALVSVYASEAFIYGCLHDLTQQTLYQQGRLEVIVVNTASPEGDDAIIRQFVERYPHFVYLHVPERETVYAAWNRAIVASQAEFLTSASTDDRHRPDALARVVDRMSAERETDPTVGLVSYESYVHNIPNQTWRDPICYRSLYPRKGADLNEIGPNPVWWKGMHREWGLFDATFRAAADHDFYSLKARQEFRFVRVEEPLGLWYRDTSGRSNLGYQSDEELKRMPAQPKKPEAHAVEAEWAEWSERNESIEILRSSRTTFAEADLLPPPQLSLGARFKKWWYQRKPPVNR